MPDQILILLSPLCVIPTGSWHFCSPETRALNILNDSRVENSNDLREKKFLLVLAINGQPFILIQWPLILVYPEGKNTYENRRSRSLTFTLKSALSFNRIIDNLPQASTLGLCYFHIALNFQTVIIPLWILLDIQSSRPSEVKIQEVYHSLCH